MRRFDLRSLHFGDASEVSRTLSVDVEPFLLSGVEYDVAGNGIELTLTATRVGSRLTLHATGEAVVVGPCQRCLGDAAIPLEISAVEYVRGRESEDPGDDAYVRGGVLDAEAWVRDAIAEALPGQLLCADDCKGLCPVCGADLNGAGDAHTH